MDSKVVDNCGDDNEEFVRENIIHLSYVYARVTKGISVPSFSESNKPGFEILDSTYLGVSPASKNEWFGCAEASDGKDDGTSSLPHLPIPTDRRSSLPDEKSCKSDVETK